MTAKAKIRGTQFSLIASMLFMAFAGWSNSFVAPALAEISHNFPDVSIANIQLIMTCGMFGCFPMTIITGIFADRFRPKPLCIIAAAILSFGALYPIIWHSSIYLLYLSNFLMGVGQGVLVTYHSILISQLFEDPRRGQLLGWSGSIQQVGSMVMMFVAGYVALLGWHNVYLTGFVTLPSLFVVIFLLPNVPAARDLMKEKEKDKNAPPTVKKVSGKNIIVGIYLFLFGVPFAVNIINSAMLLDTQLSLGSDFAGITSAVTGGISILTGCVYYFFAKNLKSHLLWVGTAVVTLGLTVQYFGSNFAWFLFGGCLVSIGFVFTFTGCIHAVPKIGVPENQVAFGVGFVMALQSLGSMVTPYLINPLGIAFFGEESAANNYKVAIIWGIVVVIVGIVWAIANRKYYVNKPEQIDGNGKSEESGKEVVS